MSDRPPVAEAEVMAGNGLQRRNRIAWYTADADTDTCCRSGNTMTTVLVLLVCFSSVVRADGPNDENSVAGLVKELANHKGTIAALTAALEAKQMDRKHIQLTTGGEVVELVRAADVKALTEQVEAHERKMDAQDAKLAAQELARITELDATTARVLCRLLDAMHAKQAFHSN